MSGTVFVDTNVLVYARDRSEESKQRRAVEWMAGLWETRLGRLSTQVLQEYYVTVTAKLDPPRSREDAREDVISLTAWNPAQIDLHLIERAWSLQDRFSFSWWDALIVASGLAGRSAYLLSEDLQDGQVIEGMRVISPFTHDPASVLG
jgi:predicted nucleic acid-binding protein